MASAHRARVLLIEDNSELLQLMAKAFRAANYEVETASDGAAALKQHQRAPFDLVVTDVFMPGADGIEVVVGLKASQSTVRIIAISGGFGGSALNMLPLAQHLGADWIMAKPFRMEELVAVARQLLEAEPRTDGEDTIEGSSS